MKKTIIWDENNVLNFHFNNLEMEMTGENIDSIWCDVLTDQYRHDVNNCVS